MNRLRKVGVIMLLVVIVSTQLIAADGDSLSPSFLEYMRGPEMYSVLQDTHKILGYTSAALGIAACVFNPVLVDDDLHNMFGSAAAISSAVNIGVGLVNYGDRVFSPEHEKAATRDVLHAALSVAGSILMIAATGVEAEDDEGFSGNFAHAALGIAGAGLMASSIVFEW